MKRYLIITSALLWSMVWHSGCVPEDTVFDHPFVYIVGENGGTRTEIWALANGLSSDFYVYLSSKTLDKDLVVNFEVIPGDGLQEGVDYVITSPQTSYVTFPPGLYDNSIRIKWLSHQIDPAKDNTVTIVLTDSNQGVTLGFPGPDKNNINHIVTKYMLD